MMEGKLGPPPPPPPPADRSVPCGAKGFGGDGGEVELPLGGVGRRGGAASTMVEPMSTEWTDEKHSLYLNSIEASFVNQLHSSNYLLGWTSRTQKDPNSLRSHLENIYSGQFKALRGGCWGEVKFERPWSRIDIQNDTCVLLRNPWIQHFRSTANDRMLDSSSIEDMEDAHACSQAAHVGRQGNGITVCEEATSSSQLPSCCTPLCRQDSVGSNSEVSDQNFVVESEGVKQLSRICKKRPRTTVSDAKDQVVPFGKMPGMSSTDANFTTRGKDAECSNTKTAKFGCFDAL